MMGCEPSFVQFGVCLLNGQDFRAGLQMMSQQGCSPWGEILGIWIYLLGLLWASSAVVTSQVLVSPDGE